MRHPRNAPQKGAVALLGKFVSIEHPADGHAPGALASANFEFVRKFFFVNAIGLASVADPHRDARKIHAIRYMYTNTDDDLIHDDV